MDNCICARVTLKQFGKLLIIHSFERINRAATILKCWEDGCQKTLFRRSMWPSVDLMRSDHLNKSLGKKYGKICTGIYVDPETDRVTNLSDLLQTFLFLALEVQKPLQPQTNRGGRSS